jgi:hypothetical protein
MRLTSIMRMQRALLSAAEEVLADLVSATKS